MKKWLEQFARKYIWIPNICIIDTYAATEDGTELHAKAICVVKAKRMLKPHEADYLKWELVKKIKQETGAHRMEETKKDGFCDRFRLIAGVYASEILKENGSCRLHIILSPNC